jgi:dihydroorotase
MNEGIESTLLGLKGIPKISEELIIERDINILEYTGGKIHFPHVSSPRSLDMIRAAKKKGLKVTCDVAAYQIALDDSELKSFDSYLKVNPPLRSKEDIEKIIAAIADDTIDAIVSDHIPQDEECKNLEFDMAEFGMIGLETAFAVVNTYAGKKIMLEKIIEKMSVSPRKILKLNIPKIEEGQVANLTLFDPHAEWSFTAKDIKSKSKNSPFTGRKLKGRAVAVFNKNKYILNI